MKHGTATAAWIGALVLVGTSTCVLSCETNVVSLTGPDDCTQYLCTAGSEICCSGAGHGTWDAARGTCACPSAPDAGPDVRDDADVEDGSPWCDAATCYAACLAAGGVEGTCMPSGECRCTEAPFDGGGDADVRDYYDGHDEPCTPEMGGYCNVVLQCGCAAGERCVLNAEGFEECGPIGGDPIDTLCDWMTDDCVAQNQCYGTSETDRRCMQFCYEDTDCPGSRTCDYSIAGVTGYRLCGPIPDSCDVFTAEGCAAGEACLIEPLTLATSCAAAGPGEVGDACDGVEDCRSGTACHTTDGSIYRCHEYCDLAGTAHPCPFGLVCGGLGHPTIGVCNTV